MAVRQTTNGCAAPPLRGSLLALAGPLPLPDYMSNTDEQPTPQASDYYHCGPLIVKATTLLPRSSVSRSGPAPKLLRSGRWHLPVWLLLVAAATPGEATVFIRWYGNFGAQCLGLPRTSTTRATVTRVLKHLERERLITFADRRQGRTLVRLLALDGSGDPYSMPRHVKTVRVPTGPLFQNGWHKHLSPAELDGLLIALTEVHWQYGKVGERQWEKSRDAVARDYGIAASTWSKAKQGLLEKGLLEWDLAGAGMFARPEKVPTDRYTVHPETLELDPAGAPSYQNLSIPTGITAPSGAVLRMHHQLRVQVPSCGHQAEGGCLARSAQRRRPRLGVGAPDQGRPPEVQSRGARPDPSGSTIGGYPGRTPRASPH